jgi:1,2-diacylglycerol 3-alpha-glucosyltransferase
MRILMASHGYPPTLSGVTLVVQKVARAMVQRGHEVTVITASDQKETYEHEDEGVRVLRRRGASNPWWKEAPIPLIVQKDLEEILAETRPDMLHAHDSGVLGVQIARLNGDKRLPRVASCYFVPRFAARYLSWNDEPQEVVENVALAYSVWLYNHFDCVVFSTAAHREFFIHDGLDVPSTVISNGCDTSRYHPGDEGVQEVEARYNLPAGPRILFVSRLAKDKEIDVLIQGMQYLCALQGAHLLLVGRGDERQALEHLRDGLGLQECVHFLGYVPEEDLPAIYRASDLFSMMSIYEVQSIPTLQALATGLPVVAADAVALPEIVHHGSNGFLVPPRDPEALAAAWAAILQSPELAARMGQESLVIVREHAETYTFDQYENLYRETLAASQLG